jgi:uracil-DNA glycosylase
MLSYETKTKKPMNPNGKLKDRPFVKELLDEIHNCTLCTRELPLGPNPVIQANSSAELLIIGQAPGIKVHTSGIPWNDASGKRLRSWLNIDDASFYNPKKVAIVPMGFCYPGKGKSGDLPPRPECAMTWHNQLISALPNIKLTLLIGQYSQKYYLSGTKFLQGHRTLTERVRNQEECPASFFLLPHPSPRNQIWIKRNPWFEAETLPMLQQIIATLSF